MKTFLLALLTIFTLTLNTTHIFAQDNEETEWFADFGGWLLAGPQSDFQNTLVSWNILEYGDFRMDTRYNFDYAKSASIYLGYSFRTGNLRISPHLGFIFGQSQAIGPMLDVGYSHSKFSVSSINQITFGVNDSTSRGGYHWLEIIYRPVKWFGIGLSEQGVFTGPEPGSNGNGAGMVSWDFGPVITFSYSNFYAKAFFWDMWDADNRYFAVGFGGVFGN